MTGALPAAMLGSVSLLVFALPLAWLGLTLLTDPGTPPAGHDRYRALLLLRTLAYAGLSALIAAALALPVARVIGRGRGLSRAALLLLTPASLLLPSLVYAYGFQQVLRLARNGLEACGLEAAARWLATALEPAGTGDILRCCFTLGCWLWGLVALSTGLAWRRLDLAVLQQARLDGAARRVTARLLAAPFLAGVLIVAALATQEFGVFEPTGISVVATEVRMVFDTGAFSSLDNPITQSLSGMPADTSQSARAGAALRVALLPTGVTVTLALAGLALARSLAPRPAEPAEPVPPARLPLTAHLAAWAVIGVTLLLPIAALLASLRDPAGPVAVARAFAPQLAGTLGLAGVTLLGGLALALLAASARPGPLLALATLAFLVGGQLVAIALARLFNRPATAILYDTAAVTVLAYLARFGFIALLAGAGTFSPAWSRLRELARADGAGPWQTLRYVILPAAWPLLFAGAAAVALLGLGELPATVLLAPQRPPLLTPLLMTWVHMQRYDPMIQACLLLTAVILAGALLAALLLRLITPPDPPEPPRPTWPPKPRATRSAQKRA